MNALILVGGKSSRMGKDKSRLVYYKKPQYQHVFNLLNKIISKENIYYAVSGKTEKIEGKLIKDIYPNLGPFGAVYSAFSKHPSKSWLVLAIDIPYVTTNLLKQLIKERNPLKTATAFKGVSKKHPEPLITIWEPKAFPLLKKNLDCKNYSLVHLLKNHPIKTILIEDKMLENVNTFLLYEKTKYAMNK